MRYADGGGCTPRQRAQREALRLEAAALFAQGVEPPQVAARLRVSKNAAYTWRRSWLAQGPAGLLSKGPGGSRERLDARRLEVLAGELELGAAAYGYPDQRWTGARVADLIARRFHVRYTPRGATYLLHRLGFSHQVPVHRAVERDEQAIAAWRTEQWAEIKD